MCQNNFTEISMVNLKVIKGGKVKKTWWYHLGDCIGSFGNGIMPR